MTVSIRKGYNVGSNDVARVSELRSLESLGILKLRAEEWQSCKKCQTPNRVDTRFRVERSTTCTNCGKLMLLSKAVDTRYIVESLNYKKIKSVCNEKLQKVVGPANCIYHPDQRVWFGTYKGKRFPVFIAGFSSYNQYIDQTDSGWLCIALDWEKAQGNIHYYNKAHFVKFEDILFGRLDIGETVKTLTSTFETNPAVDLYQKFDNFIMSIDKKEFEKFEGKFVDDFIKGIKTKADELQAYFTFLSSRWQTLLNTKVVFMGGPGNPDFASLDLLEYLQECLKPDKIGEAKRYFANSTFTVEQFGKAQAHALGEDTVSIVSTNKIQPEVWRLVIQTRSKEKYYKHTILEKDTILLLISVLKLDYLLAVP